MEKVTFKRCAWSPTARAGLTKALPDGMVMDIIAAEVNSGIANLYECTSQRHHAWMVTRLDRNPDELVVVAFEGSGMQTFGPVVVEASRLMKVPLRAHVTSPLVEKLLGRLGLKRAEIVLRKVAA